MAGWQPEPWRKSTVIFRLITSEALRYKVTLFGFKWLRAEPGPQVQWRVPYVTSQRTY